MSFTKRGDEIWRAYQSAGVPSSGAHNVVKADMRQWMGAAEDTIDAVTVDARYYGVEVGGVTSQAATINAALEEIEEELGGGVLLLPPGEIIVGGVKIEVPAGCRIKGAGIGITILRVLDDTYDDEIIHGVEADNSSVSDLTIDAGDFDLANVSAINFTDCENVAADRVEVRNMGRFGITFNGCDGYRVADCIIERTTAANTQNQGISVSVSAGASLNGEITRNVLKRTAMNVAAAYTSITHNKVSDWKFGAGITTEQDALCHTLKIDFNDCRGSTGVDVNAYAPAGIENWAKNSSLVGNTCAENSGAGIDQGGKNCTVAANTCVDNGANVPGTVSGIVSRYGDATYNADGSVYAGNKSYNTLGAAGPQAFGYAEQSENLAGIVLGHNAFDTNAVGSINIKSPTTQVPNRIVNKLDDQSKTSNDTLAADSHLSVPVAAGGKYRIRGRIWFSSNGTADFKWRLTGPASPTRVRIKRHWIVAGGTAFAGVAVDNAFHGSDLAIDGTGGDGYIEFDVVLVNGVNAGTVAFAWAQNTSNGSATEVLAQSHIEWQMIGDI